MELGSSIALLLCEFGQLLLNIGPRLLPFHHALDGGVYFILVRPDLLGAVSVSQGKSVVFDGLKVDGNA